MATDLVVAFRSLRKDPRFAAVAVATLALSIGANTAVFSIADAVLFRPLPYSEPERLYLLRMLNRQEGRYSPVVPYEYVQALEEGRHGVQVAVRGTLMNIAEPDADGARWVGTIAVAPTFFDVLRVRPLHGRLFDSTDTKEPGRVAVLTHESWRQRFGSDKEIVGRPVMIGERLRDIIGVLPPGFVFPAESLAFPYAQAGRPAYEYLTVGPARSLTPRTIAIDPIVRLKPGATLARVQGEIESLGRSIKSLGARVGLVPVLVDTRSVLFPAGRPIMRLLLVAMWHPRGQLKPCLWAILFQVTGYSRRAAIRSPSCRSFLAPSRLLASISSADAG